MSDLPLHVVSGGEPNAKNIVLGWTPVMTGRGYTFWVNGALVSRTNNPNASTVKFGKVPNGRYEVRVLEDGATGVYPPVVPPDPPPVAGKLFGISLGSKIMQRPPADQDWEIQACVDVGAQAVRIDRYDAAICDPVIDKCLARGLKVMLVVPGQVNGAPADPVGFGRQAARDAFAKYGNTVPYMEFSNEPDLNGWLPEAYADALYGFCDELRAIGYMGRCGGALWKWTCAGQPVRDDTYRYVERMLDRWDEKYGGARPINFLTIHGYGTDAWASDANIWRMAFGPYATAPETQGRNPKGIRGMLDARGGSNIKIGSTENGDNTTQAQVDAVRFDFAALTKYDLPFHFVYTMVDDGVSGAFGLYDRIRGTKRPAWQTYYDAAHTVSTAMFMRGLPSLRVEAQQDLDELVALVNRTNERDEPSNIELRGARRYAA